MTDFIPYTPKVPVVVRRLDVTLSYLLVDGDDDEETINYQLFLRDEDGHLVSDPFGKDQGDLVPFMTAAQITAAKAFLEAMYVKSQKLIPSE